MEWCTFARRIFGVLYTYDSGLMAAWQYELTAYYRTTTGAGAYSSLGCLSDLVTLSCPAGRTINVTSAVYGQYAYPHGFACPNDCCPPNPVYDCTELVYDNAPEDWATIKLLCDGQTDCQFEYAGTEFNTSCDVGNFADNIQVFYNCLPREYVKNLAIIVG